MAEAFKACRTASQSISVASNGGRGSQEAADACSPRRRAIRRRHSAVDEGRGGRVVARHIDQPQPIDAIFVPRECMWDARLRCPQSVELTRDPVVEEYISSFQDHQPPSVENEEQDVITINTPPPFIEDSDSDVVCLD